MSKPIPLQFGKYYHVYNRGNNRVDIFFEERNYRYFLELYTKYIEPVADTFAYCLLRNHFHFLVRIKMEEEQRPTVGVSGTPRVSGVFKPKRPSQQFGNLFNAYAKAINKAYHRTGSLFQNPFGRVEVASEVHLVWLVMYIHHNPQKHGLVDDFRSWSYSSYLALLSTKPTHLKRDDVLAWFGGVDSFEVSHFQEIPAHQIASIALED